MENLAKAILRVMKEVKGIDKSMTVGTGSNSYKGVPDQEVKKIIGEAMAKNGLVLLPIEVDPKTEVSRWEENTQYGVKQKQSVFTEVKTKYLLLHESGESMELQGYGHGSDTQDKGAGKATTYALKYTLLYTFLVPTGKIDDTDTTHSEAIETSPAKTHRTVTEPTTDQKAAAMLKNPVTDMVDTDAPLKDIIKAAVDCSRDQSTLVKVWNAYPDWHKNKAFIDALNAKKKELVKPNNNKTKEVAQ